PGTTVEVQLSYWNRTGSRQNNVIAHLNLPPGLQVIPLTTTLKTGTNPGGLDLAASSDNIGTKGINVGDYNPRAGAYVKTELALEG
ncbi:hypothetical protein C6A85_38910, partial [Mycobacterium sp. ITM-2017-0098]